MLVLAGSCARAAGPRTEGSYDAYPRTTRLTAPCVISVTGDAGFSGGVSRRYEKSPTEVMRDALLEGMQQTFRVVRDGDSAGAVAGAGEIGLYVHVKTITFRGRDSLSGGDNVVTLAVTASLMREGNAVLSTPITGRGVQAAAFEGPTAVSSVYGLAFKDIVNRLNAHVFEHRERLQ